jgi:hypothetical protein
MPVVKPAATRLGREHAAVGTSLRNARVRGNRTFAVFRMFHAPIFLDTGHPPKCSRSRLGVFFAGESHIVRRAQRSSDVTRLVRRGGLTNPATAATIRRLHPCDEWACGAAGSALPWHGRGHRFDPDQVHQITPSKSIIKTETIRGQHLGFGINWRQISRYAFGSTLVLFFGRAASIHRGLLSLRFPPQLSADGVER